MELLPIHSSAAFSGRGGLFPLRSPRGARWAAPILWRVGGNPARSSEQSCRAELGRSVPATRQPLGRGVGPAGQEKPEL